MTLTIVILGVMLGLVVGAFGALALSAAAERWRVLGMREIAAYRAEVPGPPVTLGNRPDSRTGPRAGGKINGYDPPAPPPSVPPQGPSPGT